MRFRPAPLVAWVLGKWERGRSRSCAWVPGTNAPGPFSAVGAHSVRPRAGLGPAPMKGRRVPHLS